MKNLLKDLILVLIITIAVLISYAWLQGKIKDFRPGEIYHFLRNEKTEDDVQEIEKEKENNMDKPVEKKLQQEPYRAVWLSYLEFAAYQRSIDKNDEKHFRKFYQHILECCQESGITHIIVQVRPFGDALYESKYYPWARCISGQQGKSPGYDPLKIMVSLTHKKKMKLEAWINPYRIAPNDDISQLSENNPARKWASEKKTSRNVLSYDDILYYNPASKQVRDLIIHGVEEIVSNYDVDGIHMDDYFYPSFTEENVSKDFDAKEYLAGIKKGNISQNMTIEEWRRYNINTLVAGIYRKIKSIDTTVTFGISPSGNPENLRSNLSCYADIDTWTSSEGYIDYIMPQIYWGYSHESAAFASMLNEWKQLCRKSHVVLYTGLGLYRLGSTDENQSDYKEMQSADFIKKQIQEVTDDPEIWGYSLFSFEYLDIEDDTYHFDSEEFSAERKKLLKEVTDYLKNEK